VSKRRDRPCQAGRSKHWVKVKNRKHPAMSRVMEGSRETLGCSVLTLTCFAVFFVNRR